MSSMSSFEGPLYRIEKPPFLDESMSSFKVPWQRTAAASRVLLKGAWYTKNASFLLQSVFVVYKGPLDVNWPHFFDCSLRFKEASWYRAEGASVVWYSVSSAPGIEPKQPPPLDYSLPFWFLQRHLVQKPTFN